jgi:hypothetical protein
MYTCTPDFGIEMPEENWELSSFRERAQAACNTAELLGIEPEITDDDKEVAEAITYAVAADEEKANKKLTTKKASALTLGTITLVNGILEEFAVRVVDTASQIRLVVTNKLLIESTNPDPKIRIRALELLGKISDVGLFNEKSEVTIINRSTEDLTIALREKIRRLMNPEDVVDVESVESTEEVAINNEKINVAEELGLDEDEIVEEDEEIEGKNG